MRVEVFQHRDNRVLNQAVGIDGIDVISLDNLFGVTQLLGGLHLRDFLFSAVGKELAERHGRGGKEGGRYDEFSHCRVCRVREYRGRCRGRKPPARAPLKS